VPPAPFDNESDTDFDCDTHPVYQQQGTNAVELGGNLGFAPLPTIPLPVLKLENIDIRQAILDEITATGLFPDLSLISEVEVCINFAYMQNIDAEGFNITQSAIASKPIIFHVTTLATIDVPSVSYDLSIAPTEVWQTAGFNFSVPELRTSLGGKANVAISTGDNTLIFDEWQSIATIELNCTLLPAIFGENNNPFGENIESPYLFIGLKRVRTNAGLWNGLQLLGDMLAAPCSVGNHTPGFFQTSFGADWQAGNGDTASLFSGGNWRNEVDAVLLEVYSPTNPTTEWLNPSGDSNQGIMDAWRAVNPEAHYDETGKMIIYDQAYAVNQIQYTWLRVPSGQTNFAFAMFPAPFNGWVRLVAYHRTDGKIFVQDPQYKCSSLVYPAYPEYPFSFDVTALPGYMGHFEPNDLTGYADGDPVTTIPGLLPSNDFTPVSGGTGATYNASDSDANGLSTLSFSGNGFVSASPASFGGTNKLTVVAAISHADTTSRIYLSSSSDYGAHNDAFELKTNSSQFVAAASGNTAEITATTSSVPTNQLAVVTSVFDKSLGSAEAKIYLNGTLQGANSGSTNNTNGFGDYNLYLSGRAGTIVPWNGKIAHISIFNDALSDADRTALENDLITRFGITI